MAQKYNNGDNLVAAWADLADRIKTVGHIVSAASVSLEDKAEWLEELVIIEVGLAQLKEKTVHFLSNEK